MEIARLQIAVDALQARVAKVELDKLNQSAVKTETSTGKLTKSADKMGIALAGMVTVSTLMAIQRLSEEFVLMQSRITRLSESTDEAAVTYTRLSDIARRTGASLSDTVKLWESLNLTLKDLGGNNNQVLRLTETLQKIGAVGGSSADEMSNALRQLGQAIAGGVVRAEEFNSILENMPALAREIAAGLGIPFGELRQVMLDGGLTAEKVLQALQDRGAMVDREFAKIPRTVGQAAESLRTDLGNSIAELDKTIGASTNFARLIDLLAKGIRFTAGDFTDLEKLNQLVADRARLEDSLAMANKRTILSAKERAVFDTRLAEINAQIVEIQDRKIKQTKEESQAIGGNSKKAEEARKLAIAGLEEERKLAAMSALEREQYKAEQLLGVGATVEEIAKARELAAETYALGNAHKSVVSDLKLRKVAAKDAQKAEKEANDELLKQQQETVRQAEASQAFRDQQQQRLGSADPMVGAQQAHAKELEELRLLNAAKLIEDSRYLDLKGQAERAHAEQMMILQEENFRAQSYGNELLMASLDQLQQGATNAFVGILTGASNSQEAVQQLASAILNEAVGALVEMGIAQVKSIIMGQAAQTAATATSVAAGAATAAAWTPAAAAASIASFGGAAASGLASMASAIPAMIGLLSFEGGGFTGNGSRSGGMDGKGGFMAMVHPNETIIDHTKGQSAGGSGVTVNVIQSSEKAGTQETKQNADGSQSVDVFVSDIYGDGPRARALQNAFGLKRSGK